jgi:hypothetical protein
MVQATCTTKKLNLINKFFEAHQLFIHSNTYMTPVIINITIITALSPKYSYYHMSQILLHVHQFRSSIATSSNSQQQPFKMSKIDVHLHFSSFQTKRQDILKTGSHTAFQCNSIESISLPNIKEFIQ